MQNKYSKQLIIIIFSIFVLGCATSKGPREIYFTYEDKGLAKALEKYTKEVQGNEGKIYRIGFIEDKRTSDSIHPTLKEKNIVEWIEEGLLALSLGNIKIVNSAEETYDRIIEVEIIKLYIAGQSTSMTANVVLEMVVKNRDNIISSKIYRGSYTTVNWAGGSGEIKGCFNMAYKNLLVNFYEDISSE